MSHTAVPAADAPLVERDCGQHGLAALLVLPGVQKQRHAA